MVLLKLQILFGFELFEYLEFLIYLLIAGVEKE